MELFRMAAVSVTSFGLFFYFVTRRWSKWIENEDEREPLPLDLQFDTENLELSEKTRAQLDEQFTGDTKFDFILVLGESPDRDYVAQHLASKFPGRVQVSSATDEDDMAIFVGLDLNFYQLDPLADDDECVDYGPELQTKVKPTKASVTVKKSKSRQGAKK